jgi:putative SOS response-associated peptidase YedK
LDQRPEGQGSEVTPDVVGFLTCEPNTEVARVHPKAMPVIMTTAEERDLWLRVRPTWTRICHIHRHRAMRQFSAFLSARLRRAEAPLVAAIAA